VPGITPQPAKPEEAAADNAAAHAAGAMPPEEIAKAAKHTSSGTSSLIRALGLKINRVVIDPGHGGHDQGTEGPKRAAGKRPGAGRGFARGKLVQDRMGAEVIYTRTDDTFIPLEGRTALANEKTADLFLSIHANSRPFPRISGVETYLPEHQRQQRRHGRCRPRERPHPKLHLRACRTSSSKLPQAR